MKTVIALIIMVVMVLSLAATVGFAVQTKSFEEVRQQVNRGFAASSVRDGPILAGEGARRRETSDMGRQ